MKIDELLDDLEDLITPAFEVGQFDFSFAYYKEQITKLIDEREEKAWNASREEKAIFTMKNGVPLYDNVYENYQEWKQQEKEGEG